MLDRTQERSIPAILSDLLGQFPTLLRKETQLARVEMSEKLSQLGMGLALLVGGAVLLIPALVILLEAAVAALEHANRATIRRTGCGRRRLHRWHHSPARWSEPSED